MRWIKILVGLVGLLFAIYSAIMYFFADENKSFTIEKVIDYPLDKVYPQFSNFQNFALWNNYFSNSREISIDYYKPYQGKGSSMSFFDKKHNRNGEMSILYENPGKSLKYRLFEGNKNNPTQIGIRFIPVSKEQTKIIWIVQTPKMPLLKRSVNFWTEDIFADNIDKSMSNLKAILGNKVEKDQLLTNIKYDSLMVEPVEASLILGISTGTPNKKDAVFRNVIMNYNKVYNFARNDLGKKEDEVGFPMLVTSPNSYKDKEISYFLGVPLSKKTGVADNNFNYRTLNPGKAYVIYYKGAYHNRISSIQQLLQRSKKDTMRNGELREVFLEAPEENKDVNLKLVLPVSR